MNRFYLSFLLVLGISSGLQAQLELMNKPFMDDVRFNKIIEGTYLRNNLKFSDIQGSPYLSDKFENGKIITQEDSVFSNIELRYNAYSDDLEFKQGENIYNVAFKLLVKKAEFGNNTFGYRNYELEGAKHDGFLKILAQGKATLLVKYTIRFSDREEAKAFSDFQPARFEEPIEQYFLSINDASATLFTTKKMLIILLSDHKGEIESYLSKNKISLKDERGLVELLSFYNSL